MAVLGRFVVAVVTTSLVIFGASGAVGAPVGGAGRAASPPHVFVLNPRVERELGGPQSGRTPGETVSDRSDSTTSQVIGVTVEPGPLILIREPGTVVLRRVPGTSHFRGTSRGLRFTDARGSGNGWNLELAVTSIRTERGSRPVHRPVSLSARVERVVAMAASTRGLRATTPRAFAPRDPVRVVSAARGSGNGSYDVTMTLVADLPAIDAPAVVADLSFALT